MTKVHLALETALYYYGARYLDPKYSMWLSCDPALGEYIPQSGSDTSKLPGMGGLFNHVNHNLYHYAGNNPIKYTDPDGNALHIVAGAVTGFVSNAAINASVQIVAGLRQGQSVKESIKNIDISSVMTSGLGGAVTGAITGGASAIKTVKDAMATCKFLNGAVNVAANVAGATVNTVANNAINGETLDKDLDKNIGIAAAAGVVLSRHRLFPVPARQHRRREQRGESLPGAPAQERRFSAQCEASPAGISSAKLQGDFFGYSREDMPRLPALFRRWKQQA